jgi:dTDP-glucose 4,6-dehydratase
VARIVHTSTSEVYGTARRVPIDEAHPLQGQSPYSASKIGADKLAESFFCAYGLPVVTVRPFNTFGPRQSARAVIPAIITQALTGSTIQLGNVDTTRDFTYVSDTARRWLPAPPRLGGVEGAPSTPARPGGFASARPRRLIAPSSAQRRDVELDPQRTPPREIRGPAAHLRQPPRPRASWLVPQVSLEDGLYTIDWIRANMDLYKPGQYEF